MISISREVIKAQLKISNEKLVDSLAELHRNFFQGRASEWIAAMNSGDRRSLIEGGYVKISSKSLQAWLEKLTENQFEALADQRGMKGDDDEKLIEDDMGLTKAINNAHVLASEKKKTSALDKLYLKCANPVWETTASFQADYKRLSGAVFDERIRRKDEEEEMKDEKETVGGMTEARAVYHDEKVVVFVKNQTSARLLELYLAEKLSRKGIGYSLCTYPSLFFGPF